MRIQAENASTQKQRVFERVFMCGDTLADMQAAANFGASGIWCAWGYVAARPETRGDFLAERPLDILKITGVPS
jgi:phosphoglycolate phosphatase-like HAD superfamily hydrolase